MTIVPPMKSQGIKTKLVPWILECLHNKKIDRWVEPFMGTGAVAFNVQPRSALLCDSNPHLIHFYSAIQKKEITRQSVKGFLNIEGQKLLKSEGEYYYTVRERFNTYYDPLDFLFLSRSCFNGMMRFNKNGKFNVPFCKKPERFAQSLITKISNQIDNVARIIELGDYKFVHQDYKKTISSTTPEDVIYCDPPYIGRHVDYFDSWTEEDEINLYNCLINSKADFLFSTWLKNKYRHNHYIFSLWSNCSILTKEHFYHVGAKESNRNPVLEALLTNFNTRNSVKITNFTTELPDSSFVPNPQYLTA